MSFEPIFTILKHEKTKKIRYKCNLCAYISKHTTLSVTPCEIATLKRHIENIHSDEENHFEEVCIRNEAQLFLVSNFFHGLISFPEQFCFLNSQLLYQY